ncbi:lipoyl(octanoyl) transferase LipB [Mycobacteroides abscessus]|uniref:lipoyl(octanoyl) transferase LipB n=1 Tax=Mycobacteroides abscessus TaxID=36809 RepID=UPI0005E8EE2D|nr:lipoyl(octanoyl) transferase LipB [Mycobacteroides abscessus]MBE5512101.1 lipoyl(octanoyl) transferase [Mycobacteroides abscessus]MBN7387025.1 lipoyl(octanoyl) transferase LipB [Mycobacteroides abscessus subsp. abscessus]MBN7415694.1 lipoyl(octanoyl) transferase LipB [Mycobacteroides abscessus subsp. abscessus]MBN7486784.1 lipoyl(octanoyl) transferase LipB [Mycobacteroides abscessus subsp. abscessus]MBN7500443.1 lipoyl(octanoyl) transferase LipB [Mycobacteroides abscessus subsp. abscessus]
MEPVHRSHGSIRSSAAPVEVRDLGVIDYEMAWELQRDIVEARVAGGPDTLLTLQHPAVYTAGRRTEPQERPINGAPVIDTDRGGKITWHGPGQLVGYPIVQLAEPIDVVNYVRRVEESIIAVCAQLGVQTKRVEGRSGVWLAAGGGKPERKIAAIGVRVQRGVTMHGFSLNCNNSLDAYLPIVACGITDAGVTTLSAELGRDVTIDEVHDQVVSSVLDALEGRLPVGATA